MRYIQEVGLEESGQNYSSSKLWKQLKKLHQKHDAKLAKWLVGDVSALLNKNNIEIDESNLSQKILASLLKEY